MPILEAGVGHPTCRRMASASDLVGVSEPSHVFPHSVSNGATSEVALCFGSIALEFHYAH